jgi:cellulose biosynthesis protein BcsQ
MHAGKQSLAFHVVSMLSCRTKREGTNMRTICIAAQKGGAGKTTLARNLAVAAVADGLRVLCLDLDPQQSLRQWWQGREGDAPAMLQAAEAGLTSW